ncbi:MAG: nucleoside-diphosphate-sugar epimerase [Pseudorhodobacter sp.]|jgi:nucleoside-diphosphate-sugar epimerase
MVAQAIPFLISGGTGRVGTVLRKSWPWAMRGGLRPIWQARDAKAGYLAWDILNAPCPDMVAGGVILALAGVTRGGDLAQNTDLALAACHAAASQGARHVFLASSAAVYGASDAPLTEDAATAPAGAYGEAKLAMERAALDWHAKAGPNAPSLTILRIGNIAGLDALLGGAKPGLPVVLDPVAGSDEGPVRSYIGPVTLGAVLARLATVSAAREALPTVLNIATPLPVTMAALLDAAGIDWGFGAPRAAAIARVVLDTSRLQSLSRLPPPAGRPAAMVAEWRGLGHAH